MVSEKMPIQSLQEINLFGYFVVVRVRFEQPDYLFREESELATICLVKNLETAISFDVESITTQNTALGMIYNYYIYITK